MKISKEKNRTFLSLNPREVEELEYMISYADSYCECMLYDKNDTEREKFCKDIVAALRKWSKAFGKKSNAHAFPYRV